MIASTQITNTEVLAFIAVLFYKLLSSEVLFINRKTIENVKNRLLFNKSAKSFTGKLLQNHK